VRRHRAGGGALLQRNISSASYFSEKLGWYADVPVAIKDFESLRQELQQLKKTDVHRSMYDEDVPSGIAALRLGLVQIERLRSIRDDIAALKLPVLRGELLSHADRTPPDTRERQVERLAELEGQLHNEGLIGRGRRVDTYRTNYDSGVGEFSVENTIVGVNNILLHAHCDADGEPKEGDAVHWKERRYRYVVGHNGSVPNQLRPILLDDATKIKNNHDANPSINTL
jgi:hypothetical protein